MYNYSLKEEPGKEVGRKSIQKRSWFLYVCGSPGITKSLDLKEENNRSSDISIKEID